jgi:hypothetical protein
MASVGVEILRVVIASNISSTVLTDFVLPEWVYLREEKSVANLFRSLLSVAKEFDEGIVHYVSFQVAPAAHSPPRPGVSAESVDLNLALTMSDDVIVGVFYKALVEESVTDRQNSYVEDLAQKIFQAFTAEHLAFYRSLRSTLEQAFQKSEELPREIRSKFASFSEKIPGLLSE